MQEMMTLNSALTYYYLELLTGMDKSQILDWNPTAIDEVKKTAFEALSKYYSIELPSDNPKDVLLRQTALANTSSEIAELVLRVNMDLCSSR